MRYREYRRKCKETKNKRLAKLADISGYPSPAIKRKTNSAGKREYCDDNESYDFVERLYRGKSSKMLKKQYAKKLRNGKNKYTLYTGSAYKRASGDFWWDYC